MVFCRFAIFLGTALPLATACSDAEFAGQNVKQLSNPQSGDRILVNFAFSDGGKSLKISAILKPKSSLRNIEDNFTVDFALVPGSVKSESAGGFPEDLAKQLSAAPMSATLVHDKRNSDTPFNLKIKFTAKNLTVSGKKIADQNIDLSHMNKDASWAKSEGALAAFQTKVNSEDSVDCKIEPNGAQPKSGVYFVILTKPAPCDFVLPNVLVQGYMGGAGSNQIRYSEPVRVPIGTYWTLTHKSSSLFKPNYATAHDFPLIADAPKIADGSDLFVDNGFILVQPDNKSYLLADAGLAVRGNAAHRSALQIAKDISASLNFGTTTLLQPTPGQASDNFASATIFKKGSIIAIYDDTPDMAGKIDVNALITAVKAGGLSLTWDAKLLTVNSTASK